MLDEVEFKQAYLLYKEGFRSKDQFENRELRFQKMLDYYFEVAGIKETEPNVILHHRIAQYGPPCENCGKPYRTPLASFCAAGGNRRLLKEAQ